MPWICRTVDLNPDFCIRISWTSFQDTIVLQHPVENDSRTKSMDAQVPYTQWLAVAQLLSPVQHFATPWTAAHQASLSFTISRSLLRLMSIESVMLSNHVILCHLLYLPSIFPSIRDSPNELALCIRWPNYWNFRFSMSYSHAYSELSCFGTDWLDHPVVQGTQESPPVTQFENIYSWALSLLYGPTLTFIHDYWKNIV